jgi:serine/threonine-protein kinase
MAALSTLFAALLLAGGVLLGLVHATAALALWVLFALLSRRRFSPAALRAVEYAVFSVMTANLVAGQYIAISGAVVEKHPLILQVVVDTTFEGSILLVFAHAMLIPNTARAVIGPVALLLLAPALTTLILSLRQPDVRQFALAQDVSLYGNPVMGLAAAGLAIYGAHVLSTMRQEVFEARRLNQYQLRGLLGSGGMGEVHRAEHRLLRRPCAIKLIRPSEAGDPRALERFQREVRATARLAHPNIIEVYDYGLTADHTFYYVMELLSGLSLADLVGNHGPQPPARVIHLLRQACDGLAEAHAGSLVHRDIKPGNIFLARIGTRTDVVKLLDFGLVKDPLNRDGELDTSVSGTPQYMAPEQVHADPALDSRCDLYSLGAVGYFLLTGRPPFLASGPIETMLAHTREPVLPPSHLLPNIPADLEAILLRCLEKSPADRFTDANSLGLALSRCADAGLWDSATATSWWQGAIPSQSQDVRESHT